MPAGAVRVVGAEVHAVGYACYASCRRTVPTVLMFYRFANRNQTGRLAQHVSDSTGHSRLAQKVAVRRDIAPMTGDHQRHPLRLTPACGYEPCRINVVTMDDVERMLTVDLAQVAAVQVEQIPG